MSTSRKIFDSLKKNSNTDSVADFLQELFIAENNGLRQWNALYDELIDKYFEEYK